MPRSLSSLPFRLLLASTALAFGGYALLLPVVRCGCPGAVPASSERG
ncbi:hypothetical protein [Pseudonocardia sp. ICBG601]|nr:hypothetical protein [Pseudonocardia sp. ICBG601]